MDKPRFFLCVFISCFIILMLCSDTVSVHSTNIPLEVKSDAVYSDLVEHPIIWIEYEENFTDYGFSGEGTKESPYRLEGVNITSTGYTVYMKDTRSYFEFENCVFNENDTSGYVENIGFYTNNVTNGRIHNCTFSGKGQGLFVEKSYNFNISDCLFVDNIIRGFASHSSYNFTLTNCTFDITKWQNVGFYCGGSSEWIYIENCTFYGKPNSIGISQGAYIGSSQHFSFNNSVLYDLVEGVFCAAGYSNITNNQFYNCETGITMESNNYRNLVRNNLIDALGIESVGIYSEESFFNEVVNNSIFVSEIGIHMYDITWNCTFTNNTIKYAEYGILARTWSTNNTINGNKIFLNDRGIKFNGTDTLDNYIFNNTIAWNSQQNAESNAGSNYWNFTTIGNKWSDYGGVGNYPILGSAGDVDYYPLAMTDVISPTLDKPSDIIVESNSTGRSITWQTNDAYPYYYEVYENDSKILTDDWYSGSVIFDVPPLQFGDWNYTLIIYDGSENSANDSVIVTAIDTTYPTIDSPSDFSYEGGSTNNWINWTPSDFNPDYYFIEFNGSVSDEGIWISGMVNFTVDGLPLGEHTFTLHVNDSAGLESTDSVSVTVVDTIKPVLSDESDIGYESGTKGHWINWSAFDLYPASFEIIRNGTVVEWGLWLSSDIKHNTDYLRLGIYNLTLRVIDEGGNWESDQVIVTVLDTILPTISDFDYMIINHGIQTGITWTAYDYNPDIYVLYLNDTVFMQNEWLGGDLTIYLANIDIGEYNLTIVLYDILGQTCFDYVTLVVVDSNAPTISSPPDLEIEEGDTLSLLSWNIEESYSYRYSLYVDETVVDDGTCDFTDYSFALHQLTDGIYNITLEITDTSNNIASDSVFVSVSEGIVPTISGPTEVTFQSGILGNWIEWICFDENPMSYSITRNDYVIDYGDWDGSNISINIDALPVGSHNLSLTLTDTGSRMASHFVDITITSETTSTTTTSTTTTDTDSTIVTTEVNLTEIFGEMLAPLFTGLIILGVVTATSLVITMFVIWRYVIRKPGS